MPKPKRMPRLKKQHSLQNIMTTSKNIYPYLKLFLLWLIYALAINKVCHHDLESAGFLVKLAESFKEKA